MFVLDSESGAGPGGVWAGAGAFAPSFQFFGCWGMAAEICDLGGPRCAHFVLEDVGLKVFGLEFWV